MGVWSAHEGELGIIQLIDSDGKEVEKGTLIIHNNPGDGSGDEAGESRQFEVPIRFKP